MNGATDISKYGNIFGLPGTSGTAGGQWRNMVRQTRQCNYEGANSAQWILGYLRKLTYFTSGSSHERHLLQCLNRLRSALLRATDLHAYPNNRHC